MSKRKKQEEPVELVTVPDIDEMDDEDFLKHLDLRHQEHTKTEKALHTQPHIQQAWVKTYRAFHDYIHRTKDIEDHVHEDEEW